MKSKGTPAALLACHQTEPCTFTVVQTVVVPVWRKSKGMAAASELIESISILEQANLPCM